MFDWNQQVQGYILGSFYIGYVLSHIPAGYLSDVFGGKYTLWFGILSSALFTFLVPVAARGGWGWFMFVRGLTGLGEVRKLIRILIF